MSVGTIFHDLVADAQHAGAAIEKDAAAALAAVEHKAVGAGQEAVVVETDAAALLAAAEHKVDVAAEAVVDDATRELRTIDAELTATARHALFEVEADAVRAKVSTIDVLYKAKQDTLVFLEGEKDRVVDDVEDLRVRVKALLSSL